MNTIVKKHYPADRLPDDLRDGLRKGARVQISIIEESAPLKQVRLSELVGTGANVHGDENEVLKHIEAGREDR